MEKGKISLDQNSKKILVDDAREITYEQAKAYIPSTRKTKMLEVDNKAKIIENKIIRQRIFIRLEDTSDQNKLIQIKRIIDDNSGVNEVVLVLGNSSNKQAMRLPFGINFNDRSIEYLSDIVGTDNVKVQPV